MEGSCSTGEVKIMCCSVCSLSEVIYRYFWDVLLQVDCTPDKCSSKWKKLRDKYVKELKKTRLKKSGDAGPSYTSPWMLFEMLSFLRDSVKHRQ